MVNSCAVPLCTNRYRRDSTIRFYRLPLKKPKLLKIWLQRIRCESIPVNEYTRVCSAHFSFGGKPKKRLGPEDIPSEFAWTKAKPQRPTRRWRNKQDNKYDYSEAPGSVTTKEKSSIASVSSVVSQDKTDLNQESLHLLADTAAMRSKTAR